MDACSDKGHFLTDRRWESELGELQAKSVRSLAHNGHPQLRCRHRHRQPLHLNGDHVPQLRHEVVLFYDNKHAAVGNITGRKVPLAKSVMGHTYPGVKRCANVLSSIRLCHDCCKPASIGWVTGLLNQKNRPET